MHKRICLFAPQGLFALVAVAAVSLAACPPVQAEESHGFLSWWLAWTNAPTCEEHCRTQAVERCPACPVVGCAAAACQSHSCASTRCPKTCTNQPCAGCCDSGCPACCTEQECKGNCKNCDCPKSTPVPASVRVPMRIWVRQCGDGQECQAGCGAKMAQLTYQELQQRLCHVVEKMQDRTQTQNQMERVIREQQAQIQQMTQKMDQLLNQMQALQQQMQTMHNQPMVYPYPPYPYPNYGTPYGNPYGINAPLNMPYYQVPTLSVPVQPMGTVPPAPTNSPVSSGVGATYTPATYVVPLTSGSISTPGSTSNDLPVDRTPSNSAPSSSTEQTDQIFSFYTSTFH